MVIAGIALGAWTAHSQTIEAQESLPLHWSAQFAHEVDRRLDVPVDYQRRAMELVDAALSGAGLSALPTQVFVVVDRSAMVQAAFVVLRMQDGTWHWIGATAVSTGKVGSFEHFLTPLGVFAHTLDNPDFRAQGTFNKNHIQGYGTKGRRVFDFGWQIAMRGWGKGGTSPMRLQMHATDPHLLEPRLGSVASEGCIRIPATLNVFLDKHGILDADYEEALVRGKSMWVIRPGRPIAPWPGRYMVVIDSLAVERPAWAALPSPRGANPAAPMAPAVAPGPWSAPPA